MNPARLGLAPTATPKASKGNLPPQDSASASQRVIADSLGLSRATVSRCFTNHPGISPETRAKVFDLASRMGYSHLEKAKPRAHTPKLHKLQIGTLICMDLPNFENTLYENPGQQILVGVTEYLRTVQTSLDLHYVKMSEALHPEAGFREIASSRRRLWKGVLLIYPFPKPVVDELMASYPIVSLVEQYGTAPLNCVDVDHHRGVNRLVDALSEAGHRRIGFFSWGYPVQASWALRRFGAYMEKLASIGIQPSMGDTVFTDGIEPEIVAKSCERVLELSRQGVTAWICAADHQAYDLITWLNAHGVSVPRDLSVVGFDGIARPPESPALSTIEIPYRQIGLIGAKRLHDLVHKRFDLPQHILLDCVLRQGETIAPPPSSPAGKRRQAR